MYTVFISQSFSPLRQQITNDTVECSVLDVPSNTTITDLDDYSLLLILDLLDLGDLISVAEITPNMRDLIERHYIIGKYRLNEDISSISINYQDCSLETMQNANITIDCDGILRLLRHYGSIISHLNLHIDPFSERKAAEFAAHIGRYCRETLTTLHLRYLGYTITNQWNSEFPNVHDLKIRIGQQSINFPQIFPNIHSLSITVNEDLSYDSIHLHQLKHVNYRELLFFPSRTFLRCLIRSNRQLESFRSEAFLNIRELEFISVNLVELKTLEIASYPYELADNEEPIVVHFPEVKEFTLVLIGRDPHEDISITFDKLEFVEIRTDRVSAILMEFITRNQQLRRISLPRAEISNDQFDDLLRELPDLVAAEIRWNGGIRSDRFVDSTSRGNLEYLVINRIDRNEGDHLVRMMPTNWTVKEQSDDRLELEHRG